ncbi:MAG: endonuclease/exonuclease/phosphatase family protein [Chromatiales bacterium]|nr:endonuclease/exonuclease/phosphatase family protein [Chromatiales bacterium]
MKIITWNCNGAFRKKYHALEDEGADILVIQECEDPARSTKAFQRWAGSSYLWSGENKNKGIGVFARSGYELRVLGLEDDGLQLFLPFSVNDKLNLIAVWTKHAGSPNFRYIGQFWKYLQLHKDSIRELNPVICGDFNSNVIWDDWDRWWNHSDVVRELDEIGFESLYHFVSGEAQGKESSPTLYLYRKTDRPYHIDYVFVPSEVLAGSRLKVGVHGEWLEYSDHMPVIFEVPSLDKVTN